MYTGGLKIHCGSKDCDPESLLRSYYSRWTGTRKRWYTLWWTLLRRHSWGRFAYIQHDQVTLQIEYLLRNDAEYDFGHEDNSMDWPAHQCAEFETALKLRVIRN